MHGKWLGSGAKARLDAQRASKFGPRAGSDVLLGDTAKPLSSVGAPVREQGGLRGTFGPVVRSSAGAVAGLQGCESIHRRQAGAFGV